jgi:S1-C subfamily serine protease
LLGFGGAADLNETKRIMMVEEGDGYSLGVLVKSVTEAELEENKIEGGARIIKVVPGSAAEEAGLLKNDIILELDGKKINSPDQLHDLMEKIEEPRTIKIVIYRDGKNQEIQATLKHRSESEFKFHMEPEDFEEHFGEITKIAPIIKKKIARISNKGGFLGIHATNLSDQLKEYFEVNNGVLVEKVIEESPAEKAGLKAGDIVIKIDDKIIEDYSDLVRTLNYYDPGNEISVLYSRKGKEKTVKVSVEKKPHTFPSMKWIEESGHHEILKSLPELEIEMENLKDLEQELDDIKVEIKVLYI